MASMQKRNCESDSSHKPAEKKQRKSFRFSDEMIDNLITCLLEYKVKCEYANIDFDADKPVQYRAIREEMAKLYADDEDLFGPPSPSTLTDDGSQEQKLLFKQQKKEISRGYQRILEKIKDLRQGFSKAILSGTRSGSGKIVYEYFDRLKQIWGSCPNTKPLACGVDSNSVSSSQANGDKDVEEIITGLPSSNTQPEESSSSNTFNSEHSEEATGEPSAKYDKQTKKSKGHVATLIDDKRKHLERRLSASQRDALLLKEAIEDREERKEIREMLKTSNDSFAHALDNISQSMLAISNSIANTLEVIGHVSSPQNYMQPHSAYYNINQEPLRLSQSQGQQANSDEYFELQPASPTVFYQNRHLSTQRE